MVNNRQTFDLFLSNFVDLSCIKYRTYLRTSETQLRRLSSAMLRELMYSQVQSCTQKNESIGLLTRYPAQPFERAKHTLLLIWLHCL